MTKSITESDLVQPSAALYLTGKDLEPQKITEKLGVKPLKSYKKGDKRQNGEKDWSHGLWMISSSENVSSLELMTHIKWLLDQLEPAKMELIDLLKDELIDAVISCVWVMPSSHEVLIMTPELLRQISLLNIRFKLAIVSSDY